MASQLVNEEETNAEGMNAKKTNAGTPPTPHAYRTAGNRYLADTPPPVSPVTYADYTPARPFFARSFPAFPCGPGDVR